MCDWGYDVWFSVGVGLLVLMGWLVAIFVSSRKTIIYNDIPGGRLTTMHSTKDVATRKDLVESEARLKNEISDVRRQIEGHKASTAPHQYMGSPFFDSSAAIKLNLLRIEDQQRREAATIQAMQTMVAREVARQLDQRLPTEPVKADEI